jgi:hypothetical protein
MERHDKHAMANGSDRVTHALLPFKGLKVSLAELPIIALPARDATALLNSTTRRHRMCDFLTWGKNGWRFGTNKHVG